MKKNSFSNLKWITIHHKWVCSKLTIKAFYENNKELFSLDGKIPSYCTVRRYLIETGKKLEKDALEFKQDKQAASNAMGETVYADSVSLSSDSVKHEDNCVSDDCSLDSQYITNLHDPLYLASRKGIFGKIAYTPRVINKNERYFSIWDNTSFLEKLARHRHSKFVNVILEPIKANIGK